ncbi:class I SAM-dependent methyltransferase [Halalkalibacillus sediminis]|uniref:class I SAM-dependent methyltransferase n=1 Tax=Halalkalibacillus sediminis TaxID=2018042 RepID=UPI00117B3602|nr:class I SAM-dependent methyltransferase [Halalkalibacillus sediminis]
MSNKWDENFSDDDYVYGTEPNEFIKEYSEMIPANSEVGCFAEGEGRNAIHLAKLGHRVTSFDNSEVGLEKTKKLAAMNDVEVLTHKVDLTKEKVEENSFDAAIMVFGHVSKEDQDYLMKNMFDSVKKGGHIFIEVYSEEQVDYGTGGPKTKEMLYRPVDIMRWTSSFKRLHFYSGEAERVEGKRHDGLGHVIQVVARK